MKNKKVIPITPSQVVQLKRESIPSEVIEAFNEMIATSWNGYEAHFTQRDVISMIQNKGLRLSGQELCEKGFLDVEDLFRKVGWKVEYDKPGYNEDYDASFSFQKKK